ncbi:serine/threonine protein phosphatase 2A 55 kDa regulatory subunit B beta isoform isoform X2 [Physcomitrium patens]|uniref:Serine/threonine-protein phosphatase 2A 55 kDa regulatory subunit B n=1 Tax=Physcomitrium patens TaxID=3218 RepID=A0A7I4E9Z2_PHYPA|nr:serine/threonine protein phosphatase 2A 55 kDa regulatory subunit B beta isoform-like isoform X2 [Physcomitrium patens]|eukprot:XP_024381158.1 serine/threonine protein phosphatase 2A 55 kDa regulatory subunit B beta isoform-like isoform X2 [Physcomitrella patens]
MRGFSSGSTTPPSCWVYFASYFRTLLDDIISAIEFDKSGGHLATGDRGGRVVLFEKTDARDQRTRKELEKTDHSVLRHPEYRYSTEFQSHEPEFDFLKSLEIEEKINKIKWCHTVNGAQFLLSTNDKTIKSWKVTEKKTKQLSNLNVAPEIRGNRSVISINLADDLNSFGPRPNPTSFSIGSDFRFPPGGIPALRLPSVSINETTLVARCRKVYCNAHAYHINSISTNSDCETYISADDLRINLWNLEVSDQSFNIVDLKPVNMEDLTEVITSAEFHPTHCNLLAYSSSKGSIRLIDMRQSALCDRHTKLFMDVEPAGNRSFLTEIIASISDIKFSRNGRYILSRDYMTLKLWDLNMEASPVATLKVHEYLRPKLYDLYENDSIFDKFECCLNGDGTRAATGSYSNLFRVFETTSGSDEASILEASKSPNRRNATQSSRCGNRLVNFARGRRDTRRGGNEMVGAENGVYDFTSELLHLAWNPAANLIACAASNSLYMYFA